MAGKFLENKHFGIISNFSKFQFAKSPEARAQNTLPPKKRKLTVADLVRGEKFPVSDMKKAIEAVQVHKMGIRAAARKYNVKHNTLHDQLKGKRKKIGRGANTIMTKEEEKRLVSCIQICEAHKRPMNWDSIRQLAGEAIAESSHSQKFKKQLPSESHMSSNCTWK